LLTSTSDAAVSYDADGKSCRETSEANRETRTKLDEALKERRFGAILAP
jgi:hypothetical protein